MLEIRIHGRGGQGVVTAAELLSFAAFREGQYAQAFPSFGSERMGAPVVSFCRLDHEPIRLREPITAPDVVVVQDPTLLQSLDVFAGLHDDGWVLVNSSRGFADLGLAEWVERFPRGHARCVPATEIARAHLGRPLPSAALLGGFAGLTGAVALDSLRAAIRERFAGDVGERNAAAAAATFALTRPEPARC
ncbi:MAG: 2-oxoacid:acceptor oxidoreductase family protein [Kofleriaceae bacterium]|nr:2-oxoacid:acceptor oxidoreductase family protein [Kofleriaceae bacterium]